MAKKRTAKADNKENENAYMIWTVVVLFMVFLASYFLFKDLGTYEYEGLTFTKEMFGQLPVYHYYYLYHNAEGELVQNNIYLRTNPERNDIPIEGDKISYPGRKYAYVSINASDLEECGGQSGIALSTLSSFLVNGEVKVRGATLDNSTNSTTPHITCETAPNNPVIEIRAGEKTQIINSNTCYRIYFSRCEDVIPATEKFIMQSIVDAREE